MEERHQELIRSNYTKLIDGLRDSVGNVCDVLYEKKIITDAMRDNVIYKDTPRHKASYLLDLIVNRGARAFGGLYEACKRNRLLAAADILRPDKAPHSISRATGHAVGFTYKEQSLPDEWPTKEHIERVRTKRLSVRTVDKDSNPGMLEKYQTHLNQPLVYPMYHKRRGNALIIVNDNFPTTHLRRREGSEWDKVGLLQLFNGLGFNIIMKENLSKDGMVKAVDEEMVSDHSDHDCFVLFVMSYGRQGVVLDTSQNPVKMNYFIDQFNEVTDLQGKPKLIFFQACQGDNDDRGHTSIASVQDEDDIALDRHDGLAPSTDDDLSLPHYEDVFVFRSSPDGTRSYRNQKWGSWFTQAVIYIFSEFAYKCELYELGLKVNDLLSRAETQRGMKNVGDFSLGMGKKLYFFPGLHDP